MVFDLFCFPEAVGAVPAGVFTTISPFEEVLFGEDDVALIRIVEIAFFQLGIVDLLHRGKDRLYWGKGVTG